MKKSIVCLLVVVLIIIGVVCGFYYVKNSKNESTENNTSETSKSTDKSSSESKSDEEGTAGSKIPLKDNVKEAEYQIEVAMQNMLEKTYGDKIADARIYVKKIYTTEDEQKELYLKEQKLGPNEIAFEVNYEIKPANGVDPIIFTAATGRYDEESEWVVDKYNLGILRPDENSESGYKITDFGTGW